MIEIAFAMGGAILLGLYLSGIVVLVVGFLNESGPWRDIIYLPLVLVWPYMIYKRIREGLLNSR